MLAYTRKGFALLFVLAVSTQLPAQNFDYIDHDFSEASVLTLDGYWEYFKGTIDPSATANASSGKVKVPSYLDKKDRSPTAIFQTTYRVANLTTPGIWISNINGAFDVYQNGRLLAEVGQVGATIKASRPYRKSLILPLDYEPGRVDTLVIVVSNFRHVRTGIDDSVLIGEFSSLTDLRGFHRAFDWFLAGFLIVGSFFFLGLFINGKGQKMALFFMLFCLSYAYRVVGWDSYALHDVFNLPYWLSIRLEYATLYLSGLFFTLYVRNLFPEETPRKLTNAFAWLSIIWVGTVLLPVNLFTRLNYPYLIILLTGIVLISTIYIRAMINRKVGANYSIYATLFIVIIFALQALDYMKVIEEPVLLNMGAQIAFFSFQSLALTTHFAQGWKKDKEKAEQAIIDLQSTQKQLIESEKMASIGVLTSGLAHEINNPLNIVGGVVEPIRSTIEEIKTHAAEKDSDIQPLFSEVHTLLDGIRDGTRRATLIINNLLGIAPKGKLDQRLLCDLSELVKNCVFLYEKSYRQVSFQLDMKGRLDALCNPDEINQVLLNVIKNALDAIEQVANPTLSITNKQNSKGGLDLLISDNGPGIPGQMHSSLFDPFVTTKEPGKGTGLGLYISKSIMLKHGGDIMAENNRGNGVTFRLSFPPPPM